MAKALRFDRLSLADTEDAIAWYEKQSPHRVSALCAALDATFDLIEQSPDRFARAFDDLDYQFAKVARFPFVVLFRQTRGVVAILGIFHTASDRAKWRARSG